MALDPALQRRLEQLLGVVDDRDTPGPRLKEDAARLWQRVRKLIDLQVVAAVQEEDTLELACHALQFPLRHRPPAGRLGRLSLRDRAEQAAELLVGLVGEQIEVSLLDRTTRLLHEVPQPAPVLDEAKLLADAVNLEDFGMTGLLMQTVQLALGGAGALQVADGCEKREQYGYWEARLKDGFHFEPVRQIALRRLDNSRAACRMLLAELKEDRP